VRATSQTYHCHGSSRSRFSRCSSSPHHRLLSTIHRHRRCVSRPVSFAHLQTSLFVNSTSRSNENKNTKCFCNSYIVVARGWTWCTCDVFYIVCFYCILGLLLIFYRYICRILLIQLLGCHIEINACL